MLQPSAEKCLIGQKGEEVLRIRWCEQAVVDGKHVNQTEADIIKQYGPFDRYWRIDTRESYDTHLKANSSPPTKEAVSRLAG